jgi:signal transduction histidine kinase
VRHSHPGRQGRGRLFWRVYLNGLLLLCLVALAMGVVGWFYGGGETQHGERVAELAAHLLERDLADPDRLAAGLDGARQAFGARMAVYRDGRLLAANVEPPPPPLPEAERERLAAGPFHLRGHRWAFAAPLRGTPGGYVVLASGWRPSAARAASLAGAVLLALALASIPLARGIAAPLERLTAAARRLGAGDLSVRVGFGGRGEVGELARAFDEMAGRVERLVQAERELLANVSHELRTPLSRIRVALELAAQGDLEASRRYLGEIGTDLSELDQLIEDVLTAARLQSGVASALPLARIRFPAAELVERSAERFRAAWPSRRLELRLDGPLPEIDADPALLRRALDNLLDNARKYSEEEEPVALSARAEGGSLILEVRDRGIGIDPEDLPRLFTPFFRTDRSRARGTGGVGLGLALARRIAEAHGGSIEVESAPGKGTAVRLRIPNA